jgi:hypothetical protein
MTSTHRLWLSLLVAFVLYIAKDVSPAWYVSPMFGCEPDIKSVYLEPCNDENPVSGIHIHRNCPTLNNDDRMVAVYTAPLRNGADQTPLIRGPPAG